MKLTRTLLLLASALSIACINPAWAQNGGGDNPNNCNWGDIAASISNSEVSNWGPQGQNDSFGTGNVVASIANFTVAGLVGDVVYTITDTDRTSHNNILFMAGLDCQPIGDREYGNGGPQDLILTLPSDTAGSSGHFLGLWVAVGRNHELEDPVDVDSITWFTVLENDDGSQDNLGPYGGGGGGGGGEGEGEGDNPNNCDWETATADAIPFLFAGQADRAAATIIWGEVTADPVEFVSGDTVTFTGPAGAGTDNSNWIVDLDCNPTPGEDNRNYNGPTGEVVILPDDADWELGVWVMVNDDADPTEFYAWTVLENAGGGGGEGEGEGEPAAPEASITPYSQYAIAGGWFSLTAEVTGDLFIDSTTWTLNGEGITLPPPCVTVTPTGQGLDDTITVELLNGGEPLAISSIWVEVSGEDATELTVGSGLTINGDGVDMIVTQEVLDAGLIYPYAGDIGLKDGVDLATFLAGGNCDAKDYIAPFSGDLELGFWPLEESDVGNYCIAILALDPANGWAEVNLDACYSLGTVYPEGTTVPVAGLVGLGALAGLFALAGAAALRRKQ